MSEVEFVENVTEIYFELEYFKSKQRRQENAMEVYEQILSSMLVGSCSFMFR